jgi:glycosyltransferase involved in cell wall biosynthesis
MSLVDIVVPCYRYGKFLHDCIESIISQSVRDVRILIIDDASPDDSAAIARQVATWDRRIEVIVHPANQGHIATYNEGIAWASAPYFLLLSADDILLPGALERAVVVMEQDCRVGLTYGAHVDFSSKPILAPSNLSSGACWTIRPGLDLVREMCSSAGNPVVTATAIVRTDVQKKIGGYRPELPHTGDMEMWLRFGAHGPVAKTSSIQAGSRRHSANMSKAIYETIVEDYLQRQAVFDIFFTEHGSTLPGANKLHRAAYCRLAERAFWTAFAQRCRGKSLISDELFNLAAQMRPSTRVMPPIRHLWRIRSLDRKIFSVLADLLQNLGGLGRPGNDGQSRE